MTAAELLLTFRAEFPEFDSMSDSAVTGYLTKALAIHAICEFATLYLAAHLIVMNEAAGVGGTGAELDSGGSAREVLSETGKSINTTFKGMSSKDGDSIYASSAYGRMYIVLRNNCSGKKFSVRVA